VAGGQCRFDQFRGINLLFGETKPAALEANKVVKLGGEGQQAATAIEDLAANLVIVIGGQNLGEALERAG